MAGKVKINIGIDYDNFCIRAAKVSATKKGKYIQHTVEDLKEVKGSFVKDEELVEGLIKIKKEISINHGDNVVSCISGKQIYTTQIPFRKLPDSEMRNALKFEIRKNLTFEAVGSAMDYQILKNPGKKDENALVLVAAVANTLLDKQLMVLEKAGIKPSAVDVLPLAVSNVLWREEIEKELGIAYVIIHLSPSICTVVIDGIKVQYYTRSIYFSAEDMFGEKKKDVVVRERERRLNAFGEELKRSLTFYEKTYDIPKFSKTIISGEYVDSSEVLDFFKEKINLDIKYSELSEVYNENMGSPKGKFDIALALGMRED